jgi:DNA-binding transcriptional LysR family regulator
LRTGWSGLAMTLGLLPNFVNTAALRYFYEVARYGSFRLAADKIHIAASAISRQLQLLEQELGVKLFVRDRKGLRLTAAGEALLYRVKRTMDELLAARSEINALHGGHTGTVRVGINDTIAREFFWRFMERFRRKYPHMRFDITVANSGELAKSLLQEEVDIIVGYALQARSGLQIVSSYDLKVCIAVRKDHPLASRKSVRVADIVSESFIVPNEDSTLRQVINAIFAKVSVKPTFMITTNSFELILIMVAGGGGIACQLRVSAGPDPDRPDLIYVPIRDQEVKTAVLACGISEKGTPSIAVSLCVEELRSALDQWYTKSVAGELDGPRSRKILRRA